MRFSTAILLTLCGCTSFPLDTGVPGHPDPRLKAQLPFAVDGKLYSTGVATVQRQSLSKITIKLPEKTYLVLVNTCARQEDFWGPDTRKDFVYNYTPAFEVENMGACPMYITAITQQGEWYRSILDFTNAAAKEAEVSVMCNGSWTDVKGSAICQVSADLPVWIDSVTPAVLTKDPKSPCPEPVALSNLHKWKIQTKAPGPEDSGLCVYVLLNKNREEFRLTVSTFTSILRVFPPAK